MNNALLEMEAYLNKREPVPGLLKIPGVTPHLVGGLYKAAAFYYRQAPWRWISGAFPIIELFRTVLNRNLTPCSSR